MEDIPNIPHSYADIEIIVKLKLSKMEEVGIPFKIIRYKLIKGIRQIEQFKNELKERSMCLFEIQKRHWITLFFAQKDDSGKTIVNYVDPKGSAVPNFLTKIFDHSPYFQLKVLDSQLKNRDLRLFTTNLSWVYSLHYAKVFKEKSTSYEITQKETFSFEEEVIESLKQLTKLKNKVKVCLETFSDANNGNIPIIPDFKCANLFVFFLESLAIEDRAFNDSNLKSLWEEIMGMENLQIIKKLRSSLLLHRKEKYVIFPQDIHRTIFCGVSCRSIFHNLQLYLKKILDKLEGKSANDDIKKPREILHYTNEVGNPLQSNEEIREILSDYSSNFIKECFSVNSLKQPEEIMFNFCVNFVPLMYLYYGKQENPFADVINLRNQLVHNTYILYNANPHLPTISIQRLLPTFKEEFLIFNLSIKLSAVLKEFPNDGKSSELNKKLNSCFISFKKEFSKEIDQNCKRTLFDFVDQLFPKTKTLETLIELYLNSLPIIDVSNEINVTDLKVKSFSLPAEYKRFTDEQRKQIFEHLILIKLSHDSLKREPQVFTKAGHELFVKNMQNYLKVSLDLNEHDFEIMCDSIINGVRDKEIVLHVLEHIKTVEGHFNKLNNANIEAVLKDYVSVMKGTSINTSRGKDFGVLKKSNKNWKLCISDQQVYLNTCSIAKNVMTVLYDSSGGSISALKKLEIAFNHELLLCLLASDSLNPLKLKECASEIAYLVPLAKELLVRRKLQLDPQEEAEFMKSLISPLLKPPNKPEHLVSLLNFKPKVKGTEFLDKCCTYVLEKISTLPIKTLHTLFENAQFESKIHKILSKDAKTFDIQEKELMLRLINYKYIKAQEYYNERDHEKALKFIDGEKGFSRLVHRMIESEYLNPESDYVMGIKYFIAKAKNYFALSKRSNLPEAEKKELNERMGEKTKEKEWSKYASDAEKIIRTLLETAIEKKMLHWELKLCVYNAFRLHLLGKCNDSLQEYIKIFLKLFNINEDNNVTTIEQVPRESNIFKTLMNSERYKNAVKESPHYLDILSIWNKIAFEYACLGKLNEETSGRDSYIKSINEFIQAHLVQRKVLGLCHYITLSSLSYIGKITWKLWTQTKRNPNTHLPLGFNKWLYISVCGCYKAFKGENIKVIALNQRIDYYFERILRYEKKVNPTAAVKRQKKKKKKKNVRPDSGDER